MVTKEIVDFMNEIRKEKRISYEMLAQRTGKRVSIIVHFFSDAKTARKAILALSIAHALGLRTDQYETCEAAVVDYYKNSIYLTVAEKRLVSHFRKLNDKEQEKLSELVMVMSEEK